MAADDHPAVDVGHGFLAAAVVYYSIRTARGFGESVRRVDARARRLRKRDRGLFLDGKNAEMSGRNALGWASAYVVKRDATHDLFFAALADRIKMILPRFICKSL